MNFILINTQYINMKRGYNFTYPKFNSKDLIILLSIILLVIFSNLVIISFAYLSNFKKIQGTITLGEIDFSIEEAAKTNILVTPNNLIDKVVYVGNFRNLNPKDFNGLTSFFFRFNIKVLLEDTISEELTNSIFIFSDADFYNDNNYYYYIGSLDAGQTVNLCNKILFNNLIDNKYQQKQIKLQFTVDAVQSQYDAYKEVWQDYPPEWEQKILEFVK